MTRLTLSTYSLFLSIILWGVLLGGIVYSHIVFFPVYLSALPDSAIIVNGTYGLDEVPFWVLIHPLLIFSLIIASVLNWKYKQRRKLILTSFAIYIVVLVVSNLFFIPELIAFKQSPELNLSPAEWLVRGNRWQYLSWIRGTVCFLGIIPLLIALTKANDVYLEAETVSV